MEPRAEVFACAACGTAASRRILADAMHAPFVVDPSHPCLPGHFPGAPVVPGVLVLEHVLAAIEQRHGPLGAMRLAQVKFARPLRPGERAQVELQGEAPCWRFRVLRDGEPVASGEVAAA